MPKILTKGAVFLALLLLFPLSPAFAWGDYGHRLVTQEAMRTLPVGLPDFLKKRSTIDDIAEFSREPDRWKNAGLVHDEMRDPAHYINLDDEGLSLVGLALKDLPPSLADYEKLLGEKNLTLKQAGYLPYALIDSYQQVAKDMAYWRVLSYLATREKNPARKAWYQADLKRRESLMAQNIGVMAHYLGDTQMPLHTTIHYNGWGDYPNLEGFSDAKIHWPIEGDFVSSHITKDHIIRSQPLPQSCHLPVEVCMSQRILKSHKDVINLYRLEKEGGFSPNDPRGIALLSLRLGQAAADILDALNDAWRESKTVSVGYPSHPYEDFVAGKVANPYEVLYGQFPKSP